MLQYLHINWTREVREIVGIEVGIQYTVQRVIFTVVYFRELRCILRPQIQQIVKMLITNTRISSNREFNN